MWVGDMGEEADYQIDMMQAEHDCMLDHAMYLGRHFKDEELKDLVKNTKWQVIKHIAANDTLTANQRGVLANHIAFKIDEYGEEMPFPDHLNFKKKAYWE